MKKRVYLTQEQADQVKNLYVEEGLTYLEIAMRFGVTKSAICKRVCAMKLTIDDQRLHMDNFRKVHKGVNNDWVYANRKSTPRSMRRDTGRNGINNTKITPAEIQLIIKLHDNDQKSFMQIGKILNRSSEKVRKEYIKNATFTEDGFYASSKWCSGCMYFGSLGSTPCCDYTYLTGHAKLREGEPACTCRYKEIGKRPRMEEE